MGKAVAFGIVARFGCTKSSIATSIVRPVRFALPAPKKMIIQLLVCGVYLFGRFAPFLKERSGTPPSLNYSKAKM
jgi:hypothetical protein